MDPVTLRSAAASASRGLGPAAPSRPAGGPESVSFSDRIRSAVAEVNTSVNDAETKARQIAEGKGDIVETVLALSKAELSLRHLVTVRNRVFESYQQIMRLQL